MAGSDPYQRFASVYDRIVEPMQAGAREVALGVVPPHPAWHVLDVRCGTATGMVPYLDAGCRVSGVDISPAMLDQARRSCGPPPDGRGLAAV